MGGFGEHHEAPPPPPPIITAIIMLLLIIPMRGASAQPVAALLCFHRPSSPQAQGHQGQAQHLHQVGVSSLNSTGLVNDEVPGICRENPKPSQRKEAVGTSQRPGRSWRGHLCQAGCRGWEGWGILGKKGLKWVWGAEAGVGRVPLLCVCSLADSHISVPKLQGLHSPFQGGEFPQHLRKGNSFPKPDS